MARSTRIAICALVLAVAATCPAMAQQRLFLTSLSPAGSNNSKEYNAWAAKVNAAAKGTVRVEVKDGVTLANFGNMLDRVTGNVVQIGWAIHQIFRGKFPLTEVGGLPFITPTGLIGSEALWRLYKAGLFDSEYKDVIPLWMGPFPAGEMHFRKAPPSIENLGGQKIAASGRMQSLLVSTLGGTPISTDPQHDYEMLQRGTVDAVIISWAGFAPYKLQEVSTYHLVGPFGQNTSMMFMARKFHDSLPAPARKAIDDNSGLPAVIHFGKFFDGQDAEQRAPVAASKDHKIVALSDAERAEWQKKFEPIIDQWAKERKGGAEVLTAYRRAVADIETKSKAH